MGSELDPAQLENRKVWQSCGQARWANLAPAGVDMPRVQQDVACCAHGVSQLRSRRGGWRTS